jgi:general secretion pathway protein J
MIAGCGSRRRMWGFSLVEALVTLALTGALLMAIGAVTGQWLPAWRMGFAGVQRLEALDMAIRRLAADIAAAKPVTAGGAFAPPLFTGGPNGIVFVRQAIGPSAGEKLEWVRIVEQEDGLTRARAPYAPTAGEAPHPIFVGAVTMARGAYRFRFAYAGADHAWSSDWVGRPTLPTAVRIEVFDASAAASLPLSTTVALRVDAPAACAGQASVESCVGRLAGAQ